MRFVNTKTLILLGIIVILLLLIKNIVASIVSLRQNSHIVTALKQHEKEELSKRDFLKQQLYYTSTQSFVEKEARDKLGMLKPGEHIVLAPQSKEETKIAISTDKTPNWQKWWKVFF